MPLDNTLNVSLSGLNKNSIKLDQIAQNIATENADLPTEISKISEIQANFNANTKIISKSRELSERLLDIET